MRAQLDDMDGGQEVTLLAALLLPQQTPGGDTDTATYTRRYNLRSSQAQGWHLESGDDTLIEAPSTSLSRLA